MREIGKTAVVSLMFLWVSAGFAGQNQDIEFVKEVKAQALPLVSVNPQAEAKDLNVLKDVVGDASIVCIGESHHLMHEQYLLKQRIVRFLVEEMGFTRIAIEDSFYGTIAIDDYIKGADISPEEALRNTGGWYLWDTEEMLSLVRWLKEHNDRVKNQDKVSYIGLDIQDPWPGVKHIMGYFRRVDTEYADTLDARRQVLDVFNRPIWLQIRYGYSKLTQEQKQAIREILEEAEERLQHHREKYILAAGEKAFKDAELVVQHLIKSHEFFLELEKDYYGKVGIREKTMFANVVRIRESAAPLGKIIVWVHNAHAARSPVQFFNPGRQNTPEMKLLGTMLKERYGENVKSIGMASLGIENKKADFQGRPDVLDHGFAESGLDRFFLDFAGFASRDGNKTLFALWKLTADQGAFLSLVPAEAFDGMYFIKHTTPAKHSPYSAQRFKKLF